MIELVTDKSEFFADWGMKQLGQEYNFDNSPIVAVGLVEDGDLIGSLMWHDYIGHSIQFSIATTTTRWCNRRILNYIFSYPFHQLKCLRITVQVAKMNKASRKLIEGCGFKYEGNIRKGQANSDNTIIYGMFQHECRFLRNDNKR